MRVNVPLEIVKVEEDVADHFIFCLSSGWQLRVFFDAGDFDYIDSIRHEDAEKGQWIKFPLAISELFNPIGGLLKAIAQKHPAWGYII